MTRLYRMIVAAILAAPVTPAAALAQEDSAATERTVPAVEQLRHVIGAWNVETDFIGPDGTIQATVAGRYTFEWVVQDKVVRGLSKLPPIQQTSAILFFHRPDTGQIEMASVGADGRLWRMIGDEDGEVRTTADTIMADGSTLMLRFTRHSVRPDSFGSTMEMSTDGGTSWRIGNQQRFRRISDPG